MPTDQAAGSMMHNLLFALCYGPLILKEHRLKKFDFARLQTI